MAFSPILPRYVRGNTARFSDADSDRAGQGATHGDDPPRNRDLLRRRFLFPGQFQHAFPPASRPVTCTISPASAVLGDRSWPVPLGLCARLLLREVWPRRGQPINSDVPMKIVF